MGHCESFILPSIFSQKKKSTEEYYNMSCPRQANSCRMGQSQYSDQSSGWRLRSSRDDLKTRKQVLIAWLLDSVTKPSQRIKVCFNCLQVIKMILAIIFLFVLCWGPLLIDNVLTSFKVLTELNYGPLKPIRQTFAIMAYSNSCINPIVYAFMSKNFRSSFVSTIQSLLGKWICFRKLVLQDAQLRSTAPNSSWQQDSLRCRPTASFPMSSRDSSNSLQAQTMTFNYPPSNNRAYQAGIHQKESRQCCILEPNEAETDGSSSLVVIGNKPVVCSQACDHVWKAQNSRSCVIHGGGTCTVNAMAWN